MEKNALEVYKAGIWASLNAAVIEYQRVVEENRDLRAITLWRRKVEDYGSILDDLERKLGNAA